MAHRTQPPSRDEIAEQTIDFIESLGHALVPWQAEMLRAMLKHDGPVQLAPPPRKHPQRCRTQYPNTNPLALPHSCCLSDSKSAHVMVGDRVLHMCSCGLNWIAETSTRKPDFTQPMWGGDNGTV